MELYKGKRKGNSYVSSTEASDQRVCVVCAVKYFDVVIPGKQYITHWENLR